MPQKKSKSYDIVIIGAGPAGCAAALGLGRSGLKVALIDKDNFPREKTCGDAIPGPAIQTLSSALPFFEKEFDKLKAKQHINSSRIMLKNGRSIDYRWKLPAYNIKREIFDHFLLGLVKKYAGADILTGWPLSKIIAGEPHLIKSEKTDKSLTAKLIIACDGANSFASKALQHLDNSKQSKVLAVRSYYKDLNLDSSTNFFWIDKKYLPGYFWAFPLPDGIFNVGFGIKTDKHAKLELKMKEALEDFFQSERMRHIFANGKQQSSTSGALIPIGGKKASYSGEAYLLAGDAAHLADPLQGHGIDKAIVSGLLAAHHSMQCFEEDDFSADFNTYYDLALKNGIERELRKNRKRQILLSRFPSLLKLYAVVKG